MPETNSELDKTWGQRQRQTYISDANVNLPATGTTTTRSYTVRF
jgi:hypothetical protein